MNTRYTVTFSILGASCPLFRFVRLRISSTRTVSLQKKDREPIYGLELGWTSTTYGT
ncbi:hypothetical protein BDN72DRAFT_836338 [Pluteus cervinus]|uniref:Uncharacterized protein n=1 Tax=Pluteus cervinus TaxID=181527 RepID=A0ACD3B418_9AGAR|nr:hypothetical protein BDN72DRAFT_836338 [Pluteus cervinus]